jgi:peroxiredoxin
MRTLLVLLVIAATVAAGDFNKVLSTGDAAPTFKDLDGTDGKKHSFDDWKAKDCLVIIFTCNTCATAIEYEDRVIAFVQKYCGKDGKTALVAINVNQIKDDLMPKMKERADRKKYNFMYLTDPSQETAKQYGAVRTPEFYVLDKDRKVVYMGAFDDKTKAADVTAKYVEDAVAAALAGKMPAKTQTPPSGCLIRWLQR